MYYSARGPTRRQALTAEHAPIPGARPELLEVLKQRGAAATPPSDKVWTDRVRHALRPLLLREEPTSFERAAYLKMNVRTLSRLAAEGTSFQKFLDEVHFAMARELLTVTDLEIRDIAKALSYSAHSPFVDALRRWSGVMPSYWRRAARSLLGTA